MCMYLETLLGKGILYHVSFFLGMQGIILLQEDAPIPVNNSKNTRPERYFHCKKT